MSAPNTVCDFCGTTEREADFVDVGLKFHTTGRDVAICDACVEASQVVIKKRRARLDAARERN